MSMTEQRETSLAKAVTVLLEKIHRSFRASSTRPIPPYEDEDFTLEIKIPASMDREPVDEGKTGLQAPRILRVFP